jgi:hypothetical protein
VNNSAEAASADADERLRRRERDIGEYIREEPLTALAIAGAVGFVLGGGANTRLGLALLTVAGRIAMRGAATNFIVDLLAGNSSDRHTDRTKARGGNRRNGNHDDR